MVSNEKRESRPRVSHNPCSSKINPWSGHLRSSKSHMSKDPVGPVTLGRQSFSLVVLLPRSLRRFFIVGSKTGLRWPTFSQCTGVDLVYSDLL